MARWRQRLCAVRSCCRARLQPPDPSQQLRCAPAPPQVTPPAGGLRPVTAGSSSGLRVGQDALLLGALPGGDASLSAGAARCEHRRALRPPPPDSALRVQKRSDAPCPSGISHRCCTQPAAGVVSATGRTIPASNNQAIAGVLQTDAEVNSQSLGGALLDSGGRLIGMPVVRCAGSRWPAMPVQPARLPGSCLPRGLAACLPTRNHARAGLGRRAPPRAHPLHRPRRPPRAALAATSSRAWGAAAASTFASAPTCCSTWCRA